MIGELSILSYHFLPSFSVPPRLAKDACIELKLEEEEVAPLLPGLAHYISIEDLKERGKRRRKMIS